MEVLGSLVPSPWAQGPLTVQDPGAEVCKASGSLFLVSDPRGRTELVRAHTRSQATSALPGLKHQRLLTPKALHFSLLFLSLLI